MDLLNKFDPGEWERREALRRWNRMCPPEYRDTLPEKIPDQDSYQRVQGWSFGSRGLVVGGPTGTGKTRSIILLLRRLVTVTGLEAAMFLGNSFAHECSSRFGDGSAGVQWCRRLVKVDVLFIDDLGKFRLTDRVESELFGLVEERMAFRRPIFTTMNSGSAQLERMLSPDRGPALVRRLRESCEAIEFRRKETSNDNIQ